MSKIFVMCGDRRQFYSWCHDNYWNPKDTRIEYLWQDHGCFEQLRGVNNPIILRWGTWYEREDVKDLDNCLMTRKFVEDHVADALPYSKETLFIFPNENEARMFGVKRIFPKRKKK